MGFGQVESSVIAWYTEVWVFIDLSRTKLCCSRVFTCVLQGGSRLSWLALKGVFISLLQTDIKSLAHSRRDESTPLPL